jgi:predicted Zn-dependent peptidase
MMEDTPDDYVHVLSEKAYWGEHSLGRPIIGNRENILRFDSELLREFFHRLYLPDRIVISAAGNVDHEKLVKMLSPAFESISPGNGFPDRKAPLGSSGVSMNPRDLEQVHICLETNGIAATDPRRYTASLMNTILGGNMSSRLFQEIRERRGMAYSIYSFMSSYTDTGISGIYVGTHPEKAPECVELFLKELQKLRETRISSDELKDAREYTRAALLLSAESVDNQMVRLAQNEIHLRRYLSMDEIMKALDAVTEEDILELARSLYQSSPLTLTLLGPVSDPEPYEKFLAEF